MKIEIPSNEHIAKKDTRRYKIYDGVSTVQGKG